MKIVVVGANGKAGKLIVKEAAKRGHDVTVVVRGENETVAEQTLVKDAMELTTEDLTGFDVVVDAVGKECQGSCDLTHDELQQFFGHSSFSAKRTKHFHSCFCSLAQCPGYIMNNRQRGSQRE